MAIYRGEGGATDVEAAPGNTEFAGGIIVEKDAVVKGNLTVGGEIYGDGSNLTGVPSVEDTYTKDEVDASQAEQDVVIDTKLSDAPNDGVMYARKDSSWQTLPVGDNVYTKAEIDAQQSAQDVNILTNNDDIARQQIEITNNTANITKNDEAINTNINNIATNTANIATNTGNISSNTTAIGTLSGQVSQNSEDIAELQNSIFFTSAYSADYPSNPNRDPEDGNMYLQNYAMFTYSYAEATQIFCSKTDESGNVRQFTAIKPGDSIVLNEVDSPNYGRYELVTVEDVSDSYVVMTVIPKMGQGTVITGVKVAFQAFPKPGSGTGDGIPEAPIDGKQYGRQDAEWTEVTGGGEAQPPVVFRAKQTNSQPIPDGVETKILFDTTEFDSDSYFDTSNNRYTPKKEGYYQFNSNIQLGGTATGQVFMGNIKKNGTNVAVGSNGFSSVNTIGGSSGASCNVYMNGTTDYVEVFAFQKSGAEIGIQTVGFFDGHLISGQSTGGGTGEAQAPVTFRSGSVNNGQTPPVNTNYTINFKSTADVEGGDWDGTYFTPNTEGWYQLSGSVFISAPESSRVGCIIQKNDNSELATFNQGINVVGGGGVSTTGLVYCNGTTDKLSLSINCNEAAGSIGVAVNTTWFSAHLITGQSSGGSGGGTTDILPVLYSGTINQDGTVKEGTGFTCENIELGKYVVTLDSPVIATSSIVVTSNQSEGRNCNTNQNIVSDPTTQFGIVVKSVANNFVDSTLSFTVTGTETIAVGGGSGGSYTPEALVWEDKTADRAINTEYTNTQDVPIYVTIAHFGNGATTFIVDEKRLGRAGNSAGGYFTETYVVPSGSKYKLNLYTGTVTLDTWNEARMPVAVGTGGKTVAFDLGLSADVTTTANSAWTECPLNNAVTDTDSGLNLSDNSYVVKTAGIYSLTFNHQASNSDETIEKHYARIEVNGNIVAYASDTGLNGNGNHSISGSSVIALNVDDVITLSSYVTFTSGVCKQSSVGTKLTGHLVTSNSASGDCIWTEEGGTAVYDGDIKVNGNVILPTVNNTTFLDNKQGLVWNTETGQIFETDRNVFDQDITVNGNANIKGGTLDLRALTTGADFSTIKNDAENGINFDVYGSTRMSIKSSGVTTSQDITVNGMTVGANGALKNTYLGKNALSSVTNGMFIVAVGEDSLKNTTGAYNTAIGYNAGGDLTTGSGNTIIGYQAQASAPDVTNEVTIGGPDVTSTRLKGVISAQNIWDNTTNAVAPNVCVDGFGILRKSTVATYSIEEVDKKLAIKDKLIEKLSARLDELEQKFNNGGGK